MKKASHFIIFTSALTIHAMEQVIQPYLEDGQYYYADTCIPLVNAWRRKKVKFKALARYTYPGDRLTNDTLGLNSVGYWDARDPQDWGLDWHRNEGIEIHFLESGRMPYLVDHEKLDLEANDLTITRPWQAHKVGDPIVGIGKFYWVILDVGVRQPHHDWKWPEWIILSRQDLNQLTAMLRQNEQPRWKANKAIRDCFLQIGAAVDSDEQGSSSSKIKLLINELFLNLLNLFRDGNIQLDEELMDSRRSVRLFINSLSTNYQEPWTVQSMAEAAGIGLTRFTHYFKQLTNMTPAHFLNIRRIEAAKIKLRENPDANIYDVAYNCGFMSSQYFATVFKKHEGRSPGEYKRACQLAVEPELFLTDSGKIV